MDATTKKSESAKPLGVIGCLTAGFEVVGRNLWLIALPVLIDLFLWLGPQLSLIPLVESFATLVMAQSTPDPAMADQVAQAVELLQLFSEQFNLVSLCSALPLLDVPSLLAQRAPGMVSPLGEPRVLMVGSVFTLAAWGLLLVFVGLVLGFFYLNGLGRRVLAMQVVGEHVSDHSISEPGEGATAGAEARSRADDREDQPGATGTVRRTAAKLVRVFLFGAGLLIVLAVFVPAWMFVVGVALTVAPSLAMVAWALSIGLGCYTALHLLFVVPGVVLGGRGLLRAIWESIVLIHTQFSSVVGLIVLVVVIYQGMAFAWSLPSGDSWLLLIGILGNACIATGLTAAVFVFYQERIRVIGG